MGDELLKALTERLVYHRETGNFFWRRREDAPNGWNTRFAGKRAFTYTNKRGYKVTNIRMSGKAVPVLAHRAAWAISHGAWPDGLMDHINGDRTDNRLENLRVVNHVENATNAAMKSNNASGVNGVYLHRQTGKWSAQINAFGKTISLGLYTEKRDAAIARKAAERVLGYHENHGRGAGE